MGARLSGAVAGAGVQNAPHAPPLSSQAPPPQQPVLGAGFAASQPSDVQQPVQQQLPADHHDAAAVSAAVFSASAPAQRLLVSGAGNVNAGVPISSHDNSNLAAQAGLPIGNSHVQSGPTHELNTQASPFVMPQQQQLQQATTSGAMLMPQQPLQQATSSGAMVVPQQPLQQATSSGAMMVPQQQL